MNPALDMQAEVARWMKAFGQDVPEKPCVPESEVIGLRRKLHAEEIEETDFALGVAVDGDVESLALVADGLCDSLVVIFGTFAALGLDAGPLFDEVMRSNWTKLWDDAEITAVTNDGSDFWEEHTACFMGYGGRGWLVRRNDGKVIKSPRFDPPNLLPLIQAQMKGKA